MLMVKGNSMGTNWKGHYSTSLLDAYARGRLTRADDFSDTVKLITLLGQYMQDRYHGRYYAKAQNLGRVLSKAYDDALKSVDLLIMPTLVTMTLASGFQLARKSGYLDSSYPRHGWIVASFIVVGVMATIALTYLEPANLAVLFELKKQQPDGHVIEKLMKRFVYTAGITGAMQVATLVIMTRLAS